jgi:hypothetical protein
MKTCGKVKVYFTLTLTLDGLNCQSHASAICIVVETSHITQCIEGWVGSRAGLEAMARRKVSPSVGIRTFLVTENHCYLLQSS